MNYSTPEKEGIKSSYIKEYIKKLEEYNLSTHSLVIMRHGKVIFEHYWAPFHKDYLHRMYSVTKSFVALAIGFLEQDGKINLDDKIAKYFPEEIKNQLNKYMHNQSIRDMLMMSTAIPVRYWLYPRIDDRVQFYFENDTKTYRPAGTTFEYDSEGSFIMGALVERVTGKTLMEYLREKCLDKIGFSEEAYMLKCPGGHSWGDSALICTSHDLALAAQFTLNGGKWNGEQLLNENYVKTATSKLIDNNVEGMVSYKSFGYGYQFWRTYDNSYFFNGMGCQFAICTPDKDMVMVYTGDNQSKIPDLAKDVVIRNYFEMIVRKVEDKELSDIGENEELKEYAKPLELATARGDKYKPMQDKINGVTYKIDDNKNGITEWKLHFDGNKGKICYKNAQGYKEIPFGMCENEFSQFPEEGYAGEIGSVKGDRLYECASSAAWVSDNQLFIKVQIIDIYFGRLNITVGFNDDGKMGVYMNKTAEDFLDEYQGYLCGTPME
ncbi:MAG: serine hydrolase [Clostridia bacterium]|nr:serine hydrolase [Clostridia bacterium]